MHNSNYPKYNNNQKIHGDAEILGWDRWQLVLPKVHRQVLNL